MKIKIKLTLVLLLSTLVLVSCGGTTNDKIAENATSTETQETNKESTGPQNYDLSEKGIPTVIQIPYGAKIGKGMSGGEIDGVKTTSISIKKDKFNLEVNMDSEPSGKNLAELIAWYKEVDAEDENFEIIKEDANGYIYKFSYEGEVDYGLSYAKMNEKGEAIEMTTGFSLSSFSLEDVETMYEAAKTATW